MSSSNCLFRCVFLLILFASCEESIIVSDPAMGIIIKGQIKSESDSLLSDIKVIGKISDTPDCSSGFFPDHSTRSDSLGNFSIHFSSFGSPQYGCVKVVILPDSNQFYKSDSVMSPNVYFNNVNNMETLNLTIVLEEYKN